MQINLVLVGNKSWKHMKAIAILHLDTIKLWDTIKLSHWDSSVKK